MTSEVSHISFLLDLLEESENNEGRTGCKLDLSTVRQEVMSRWNAIQQRAKSPP